MCLNTAYLDAHSICNLFVPILDERGLIIDVQVYESALMDGLDILPGKYYLVDAGFPSTNELLIPYRSVQYHLVEWGQANLRYIFMVCLYKVISKLITGPKIKKNCSNSVMHQLTMSLSTY